MSSSLRRGGAAASIAFSIAALTACGAGTNAATNDIRPDNASAQVDDIKVQNVNVVLLRTAQEGPGGISARLFNEGTEDQVLEGISLPEAGGAVQLTPPEGESRMVVPAGGWLALGGEGNAAALIPDLSDVALGDAEKLVFHLSETGDISLNARVVSDQEGFEYYTPWGPSPAAPAQPEESAAGEPGAEGEGEQSTDSLPEGDAGENDGQEGGDPDSGTENSDPEGSGTEGTEGTEGSGAEGTEGSGTEGTGDTGAEGTAEGTGAEGDTGAGTGTGTETGTGDDAGAEGAGDDGSVE